MWISKKNFENALKEKAAAVDLEWERKWNDRDEKYWRMESENRSREENDRRFANIERRLHQLEKDAGLVEEIPVCPFEAKPSAY